MTVREAQAEAEARLTKAGIESAAYDARTLLMLATETDAAGFLMRRGSVMTGAESQRLEEMLVRREKREPLQHIAGSWDFYGMTFRTDARALVPRMETELLVEEAVRRIGRGAKIADVGTGTGCIGLSVARERNDTAVTLMDISPDALEIAKENAERLGIAVTILRQDLHAPLEGRPYGAVLSNPPYIESDVIPTLDPEVRHDPILALDGGPDGLDAYRALADRMDDSLDPGGWMILEIGAAQAQSVTALFAGKTEVTEVLRDLDGHDRIVILKKKIRQE